MSQIIRDIIEIARCSVQYRGSAGTYGIKVLPCQLPDRDLRYARYFPGRPCPEDLHEQEQRRPAGGDP